MRVLAAHLFGRSQTRSLALITMCTWRTAEMEDKRLPISGYNYSALRDRLKKRSIKVSVTTIIDRAKRLDCYKPPKKRKTHDREALTATIGPWSNTTPHCTCGLPSPKRSGS